MRRIWRYCKHLCQRLWRTDKPVLFAALISCVVLIGVANFLVRQVLWIESDDALVQGDFATLGAPIHGIIQQVLVKDFQRVKRGQVLCKMDARERRLALSQAQERMKASFAVYDRARRDFERTQALRKSGAVSAQAFDRARSQFGSLEKRYRADEAQVEAEKVNLGYTEVTAPEDGIVAIRSAQAGMVVKKGAPLFGIVYPERKWVIAKLKETDLSDLRVGEKVDVTIDAIPGRTFEGRVDSLSSSTEGQFAAVPPDFAAGNFTKYVQRVPVKITFEPLSDQDRNLIRLGLSADVQIRRRDRTS
ncbi:MAG: HlyD family secretion protein [Bdellovibrionia bacterium]